MVSLFLAASGATATTALATGGGGVSVGDGTTTSTTESTTAVSQTATVKLSVSQTKSVQRRIGVTADGAFGAHSRAAMKRYQSRKHLARTGHPNLQTLKAMHLTFAARIEAKLQQAKSPQSVSSPPPVTTVTSGASAAATKAVAEARSQIGTPYEWGGTKPGGFDCSGLVMWSYAKAGVDLPRVSFDQFKAGTAVKRADVRAGDLVFFATDGAGASHVGIAISATEAISATSHGVREHAIFDDYWGPAYVGARRVA
jgi:cell wall-associated NlpC family hydrolase